MPRSVLHRGALLVALIVAVVRVAVVTHVAGELDAVRALWEAPSDPRDRDLYSGPWGPRAAPDPAATYTFVRRKEHGVNPGLVVRDPMGRVWHVKQAPHNDRGAEGPVEVVLSRVLSAVGYHQPPVYFLPSFAMTDSDGRRRIEPGGRFRLDVPSLSHRGTWSWKDNPFIGTQPYNGLLVILLTFNSWDLKDSNNALYDVKQGNHVDHWYVVRDLGGALGDSGHLRPKRNNVNEFERQRFITGVDKGFVAFAYHGKRPVLIQHRITVDDVRWAEALLDELSDRQWHDAFRAGGYPTETADAFIRKIRANIAEGLNLEGSPRHRRVER
jgi:hypothetical protein